MQSNFTLRLSRISLAAALCFLAVTGQAQPGFAAKPNLAANLNAEQNVVVRSLKETLLELQQRYGIQFSYDSNVAGDLKLLVPAPLTATRNVETLLTQILKTGGLRFKKVNKVYIILKATEGTPVSTTALQRVGTSSRQAPVEITLTGKVSDEKGQGLPGVTVVLKGTNTGTTTNLDGNYSLTVPDGTGTLVVSFVGYVSQEVAINNQTSLNISLVPDVKALQEVVVIGYGTQEKKDIGSGRFR
jgi:hypothetical protein